MLIAAAIGGTAEKLGGGKFANGAVTGAYVMMFNHMGKKEQDPIEPKKWPSEAELKTNFSRQFQETIIEGYVNNQYYDPSCLQDLAIDLLHSPELYNEIYGDFVLRPVQVAVAELNINGSFENFNRYQIKNYFDTGLPKVFDPGYETPILFIRDGNKSYGFVIRYQVFINL